LAKKRIIGLGREREIVQFLVDITLIIKPAQTQLTLAWEIAIWTPLFSGFMNEYILSRQRRMNKDKVGSNPNDQQNELHVGDVIQAALVGNMLIEGVIFKDGRCLDIGTPKDMMKASRMLMD
jgi:glucose-1-phosphate thymidylyltransferase